MGAFYFTKSVACLLLLVVNTVVEIESSGLKDANDPSPGATVIRPGTHYEGGATVEGVVGGSTESGDASTGDCYRPQVIIQAPTCSSAPIGTELKDVNRKLDEVLALLSSRSSNSSTVVPEVVEPKCTTPKLGEGLTRSNCSSGVQVPAGTRCTYHCPDGITLQGDPTVSCGSDGHWNQVLPLCRVTLQRDCSNAVERGFTKSGTYFVQPTDNGEPIKVYCDMETDYGGWTVFQRRQDGSVNFFRRFTTYEMGFGELEGEFWLGLDNLHRLTSQANYELRVDLEDFDGESVYEVYQAFSIGDSDSDYTLTISTATGTAGDSLREHKNMPFSTKDRDNDNTSLNCAFIYHGAWWYKSCLTSNLNGWYLGPENQEGGKGVAWYAWKNPKYSMKKSEMKFRFTG